MLSSDPANVREASTPSHNSTERAALVHREIFQLVALIIVAVGAFALTRTVAANNRRTSLRDAAEWFRRGEEAVEAGRVDDAIDDLQRAAVRDRSDKRYTLAFATALELKRDDDAARRVLVRLRESAPEDPDINLQLARLAVARSDVSEALRFYHNALYAPWPSEQADARRGLRLELIRFLLIQHETGRAQSELLALSTDLPDNVPLRLDIAQLFAKAGDHRHALDQFQRALRLSPENEEALAGAGLAAFQLGDYVLARTYLGLATPEADDIRSTRELVALILSNDPLVSRIGSAERRRRLVADISYAERRLTACLEQHPGDQATGDGPALQNEARTFERQLNAPRGLEQDTIEAGVDLVDRIERLVTSHCGPPTEPDRALMLMAHQHGS